MAEQDTNPGLLIPSCWEQPSSAWPTAFFFFFFVEGRAGPQNHGASCLVFLIPGALQRVFLY